MQATESVINVCFNSSLLKYGGDLAVGAMTVLATVMQFSSSLFRDFTGRTADNKL